MSSSDRQHNDEESHRMNFAVPIPHAPMSSSPLAALAWSLSPPVAFNATQHRDSFGRRQELESAFYRDLFCCNKRIHNLHHLLLHYEKHHHPQSQQPMDEDNSGSVAADQQDAMDIESVVSSQQQQQQHPQQQQLQPPIQQQQPDIVTTTDNTFAPIIPGTEDASEELLLFRNTGSDMQLFHADYSAVDKPYKCTVPGCLKSYKNANGLKYHREHGHLNDENDDDRPFRCTIGTCHKRYKQLSGLKYHITHAHMAPQPAFAAHFSALQHPADPFS
ncbi:hypothetical protein BDB00DRAFT_785735 [Zychaea mexicana]|uniref:uncharacterized protein n=1 Tax=Zychaea mexicana TaxID=64656 RepID=UPI0022FDB20B|nr:uncharacterized protein BDB00DRAFT_785735 [Zychaea mexicana]KAI9496311.1 hypothetical protein BDB00DRAFT_785735 [Zychaea mexicana]